ncbi:MULTISPECIES: CaiB/BaiF CoA-transferase family protein [unclassified Polynucleobacter]|jgi:formyl-CoA transferase|uniref:CaiB/BaiF CoA transferase family protein n=1 Tax=unclassified Polynucleobacter TaxID=2640945 RepID=UPI001BFEC2D1|nr:MULTISPECIES: CaiB/BaiF CoA-transferase family protein [unclassified Polynucleobacter]MBU3606784.1 CoA transferase [Polynucleobacter sp. MWH-Creno-3A4]QWD78767.1 CoA transferase [Polynucleobacter sp. MWH-Svant-W18]
MGALSHIRVLDLSRVLAGPWCGQNLADLGADVIKVERPGSGDETRSWGPPFAKNDSGQETTESTYFISSNRNKRSITLDISSTEGQEIIRQLVLESDVVLENFKVGDLVKYGLDYESLKKIKPNLIFCSITGFGQTGPYAQRPGYDFITQGMGGIMSITGEAEDIPGSSPQKSGVAIADLFTGMYATTAILAAIVHRDHTGEGQSIDMALLDTQVAMMANVASAYLTADQLPKRLGNTSPVIVPYQTFPTSDGWIIVAAGNDSQYRQFVTVGGQAHLAEDPLFITNPLRVQHRHQLVPLLEQMTRQKTKAQWISILEQAKVPCGPINNVKEVFENEQILARNILQQVMHPTIGDLKLVTSPMKFSKTPTEVRLAPPLLGQHTEEILMDHLNLDRDAIDALRAKGVI